MAGAYDEQGRRKYLTAEEGQRFFAVTQSLPTRDRTLCQFLYYTGVRVSEATQLLRNDLDLTTREAVIRTLKKREKNERRRIPLPESLIEELQNLPCSEESDRVWQISRITAWRIVCKAMELAEIEGIQATCKSLRHGFAVRAVMNKVPITKVSTLMGHAHLSTTAIYLDIQGEELRELVARTW